MAQSCVMMRPRQEHLFTPGKPPLSPQPDTSLITSTVRKRKVDPAESPLPQPPAQLEEGKRQRTPPVDRGLVHGGGTDAVVRVAAAPAKAGGGAEAAAGPEERRQQPGLGQHACAAQQQHHHHLPHHQHHHPQHEAQASGDAALFSPLFHLHREGSSGDLAVGEELALDAAGVSAGRLGPGAVLALPAASPAPLPRSQPDAYPPAHHHHHQHRQQQQEAENNSTDHSTGTSASLADADVSADVASPRAPLAGRCLAAASPAPPPPPGQACAAEAAEECECEGEGDELLEFDPLLFIKRLPPLERCVAPRREFLLPKKTRRSKQKTLVLDLDETLVHSTLDGYCRPDFTFPVEVGSMRHMVSVRQRPHLHAFLERVAQLYEVVVFTASQRVYAEQLLNIVDPQRRLVRHRVYRESCVLWEGNYLKDLTVLGRDLAHTIIVDNSPQAFGFQLDNGIPIESWYDDDADDELLKLVPFLERVAAAEDVRPHIQKRYRLRSLVEAADDPEQFLYQQQQQQ